MRFEKAARLRSWEAAVPTAPIERLSSLHPGSARAPRGRRLAARSLTREALSEPGRSALILPQGRSA